MALRASVRSIKIAIIVQDQNSGPFDGLGTKYSYRWFSTRFVLLYQEFLRINAARF